MTALSLPACCSRRSRQTLLERMPPIAARAFLAWPRARRLECVWRRRHTTMRNAPHTPTNSGVVLRIPREVGVVPRDRVVHRHDDVEHWQMSLVHVAVIIPSLSEHARTVRERKLRPFAHSNRSVCVDPSTSTRRTRVAQACTTHLDFGKLLQQIVADLHLHAAGPCARARRGVLLGHERRRRASRGEPATAFRFFAVCWRYPDRTAKTAAWEIASRRLPA